VTVPSLLPQIVLDSAERHGARLALQDPQRSISHAELAERALRAAAGLRALGVRAGDRVALVLPNSVGFAEAHFGVLLAGAVSMPMDAAVAPEPFRFMAASALPRVLLTTAAGAARLAPFDAGLRVVCLDAAAPGHGALGPDALFDAAPPRTFLDGANEHELASLMFTTGTTGRAKGVRLSHANVLHALHHIGRFVGYTAADREVVILPLSHNFGLGHLYCNLMHGGAVYTEGGLARVGRVLDMVQRFGATGFPGTPTGFGLLIDRFGPVLAERCANLRFSVINSAPLPPERAAQLQALLPRTELMAYYGLTEASRSAFISLTREGAARHRSVGRPLGDTRIEIRREDGTPAAPGETGEIVIQGPTVTAGYWDNEADTRAALRNGWLWTGDLGQLDADGFLSIHGRLKDIVNVGGYKVNPLEVERVLAALPGVADVGVAGVEGIDGATGERVVAALVAAKGAVPDLDAADAECARRLERFKCPARFVLVDAIPRTDSGKLLRPRLAALLAERLAAAPAPEVQHA
jgi:long-chain acyl-CoA synthetase